MIAKVHDAQNMLSSSIWYWFQPSSII